MKKVDQGSPRSWHGEFDLAFGDSALWRVGGLELAVRRLPGEWRVGHVPGREAFGGTAQVRFGAGEALLDAPGATRYAMEDHGPRLRISPVLPDRAVVARPVSPLCVPADESVRLYVGVPLWLRLEVGTPAKALGEYPTQRLAETWMGANTREGEVCYALHSRYRLQLHAEQRRPDRAVVPLVIRNRYLEPMALERISLPVRQLALYAEASGGFWTSGLTLERDESGDLAAVRIDPGPPAETGKAPVAFPPRDATVRHGTIRAFSALFQG